MFKNLKIGKKLIISFIIVALLASISGIFSILVITDTNAQYESALINYGFSQGDIGKAMLMVADTNRCVRDIIGFTNEADINDAKTRMADNLTKYQTYVQPVIDTLVTDEEFAQYAKIEQALSAYTAKREQVVALGDTFDPEISAQAQKMAVDELDPLYDDFYNEWLTLMEMTVNTGTALSDELSRRGSFITILTIAIVAIAIGISLGLGVIIARSISRPIEGCVKRLTQLEEGDLTTPVPEATSNDETGVLLNTLKNTVNGLSTIIKDTSYLMGEMANGNFNVNTTAEASYVGEFEILKDSMRKLNRDLNQTLLQIDQSSDEVASGADQVSSGAQALSQGATEQASSVEELAATITEIAGQVNNNAENARQANAKADSVGNIATESNARMQEMLQAMSDISNSSSEIGKIIKTIEDIAFQTNILALNAAVEAARAGSAGKGFAVVADEVRNLASKSAEASKNTAALIEGSLQAVNNGAKIADETAQYLFNVVEGVKEVNATISDIAKASDEQASSIEQVTQGLDQISSVVQTNSATAEESAAASEELSGQSAMLKDLVSQFNLRR